jgi:thymidylate synthase
MYIKEETLDDLLFELISKLLKSKDEITASRGKLTELTGVLLELTNPLARLSRTERKTHVFSSLGELLWYLSGSNEVEFITYYVKRYAQESDDGKTIHGAYGPRLLKMDGKHNQIENVISLLQNKPTSRRAVIQLFDAADIAEDHKEIPCTCTLQFALRNDRLQMFTYMRSNDAFIGLPHDVFAFTMIQELIARTLNVEIGTYKHAVGSLHLYDSDKKAAEQYLGEGYQARIAMPTMPTGSPWASVAAILKAERKLREGESVDISGMGLAPYWQDVIRLLQVFAHAKMRNEKEIAVIAKEMTSPVFKFYIQQKRKAAAKDSAPSKKKENGRG